MSIPDKWFALIANAADYNNAVKLGEIKPAAETPPLQSGFQARAGVAHVGSARSIN